MLEHLMGRGRFQEYPEETLHDMVGRLGLQDYPEILENKLGRSAIGKGVYVQGWKCQSAVSWFGSSHDRFASRGPIHQGASLLAQASAVLTRIRDCSRIWRPLVEESS